MSYKRSQLAIAVAAALAIAAPAHSQVPSGEGFFGAIDGRWMWLGGDRAEANLGAAINSTNGPGGQVMIGYRFDSRWDVALAGAVQQLLSDLTKFRNGTLSVDTNYQHFDLEVGFSDGNWRYSAGLRGIHYLQSIAYNAPPMGGVDQRDIWGLGLKAGVGTRQPISDSMAIVGGLDAALVYASFADGGSGAILPYANYWGLVPQIGGEVGLNWRSSENFSVTVGGRASTWFNTTIVGAARGTLVDVGPFIRVAYNFAGPTMRSQPVVQPETPPPAPRASSYMVFFDFDRADVSGVAQGIIRQAANDAKIGRVASIQVTGHADRAGADSYNMALSLRRANAVKAALIQNGLTEQQITVLGRGESDPLVQTADGVREPQNRRVVISF